MYTGMYLCADVDSMQTEKRKGSLGVPEGGSGVDDSDGITGNANGELVMVGAICD